MTANPPPHGRPRADAPATGRQSNGAHPNDYSSADSLEEAEELVAAPGHGGVGVFQAPGAVRPSGGPVDTTLDIDSPFLDLFGGVTPALPAAADPPANGHRANGSGPAPLPAAPSNGSSGTRAPAESQSSGFTRTPVESQPSEYTRRPVEPQPSGFTRPPAEQQPSGFTRGPAESQPSGYTRAPVGPEPDFYSESGAVALPAEPSRSSRPGPAPTSRPGPASADAQRSARPGPASADFRPKPGGAIDNYRPAPGGPTGDDRREAAGGLNGGIRPDSGAISAPGAFAPEPFAPLPDEDDWSEFDEWPPRPESSRNLPAPAGPASRVREAPGLPSAPASAPLPVPVPEKAPAKRREKAPARREPKQNAVSRREPKAPKPLRPQKLKFSDRDPAIELAISEIAGHLTFTQSTVTAWYYLPEVRWAFRPDAEREALLSAISEQYAGLAGFRLHLRRTTRPFPADEWARTVDTFTTKPLPDVQNATSWSDHLVAAQRHLLSVNHAEGQTYLGVTFARRSLGDTFSERVLRAFGRGTSENERRKLGRTVEQFDEVLNAFGMRGRRVTPQELEWLLFRSVALGMAPPGLLSPVSNGHWETGDLLALTEQVERYRTPYGSTVKLVNRMTGEERHVAVLSVGRMEPLEIPERHEPWMHFHERLPWPMELSSRLDILGSNSSFKNLEHRLRMIRSQQLDYAEHGIDAPPELERLAKRALVIGDEMTTGLPTDSARAHGWHRIAVSGANREECLERARRLIQLYSRELRISLQHPKNQDQLAREFIPGEPIANTGYVRRMPVKLLAAALPQAASTVGDRRGDLIGRTAGTCRRPVFLDLHFPMEVRERSGLGVFVAEPGGGKSTLMGALGYLNARRGVQVTLLDPSGPLARLCQMPELKPYSRVLNLTGSEQGTLAPYALIPTPIRSEFSTGPSGDREYEIAVSNARAERRMLVQDICSMLVPPQVAKEASTATLLRHAVRQVPAEETSTLDDVVTTLQGLDKDEGRELANLLLDTAEMPLALLFFGRPPQHLLGADAALTVITMAGLRLPDLKIEREYWSAEESLALPMLHTAHRLAVRRCYGGSMSSRKMVGLDEAHFMEGWRSGRSFLVRLARDSRKWNLAALVASQNPRDILGLDVQNLVSTVFVGRIAEDQEIASEALRLLRVPVHDGYEATLASLSQVDTSSQHRLGFREFVMRDVDGRVQKVRVDVSYVDGLLEHLDTTPGPATPAVVPLPSDLEV